MNRELIQKATNFGGFLLSRVPKSRFSVHKNPTDLVGSSNRFGWFIQPIWLVHPTDLVGSSNRFGWFIQPIWLVLLPSNALLMRVSDFQRVLKIY